MFKSFHRLLEIPATDPIDARKRKLVSILTIGIAVFSFLVLILSFAEELLHTPRSTTAEVAALYISGIVMLAGSIGIYFINRRFSGSLSATLFISLFMCVLPFVDNPHEISDGRSLFVFMIPIFIASVLLKPNSSFTVALISSCIISIMALALGGTPNIPAIVGFFAVALASWLSARSLEQALIAYVETNASLDKRVLERTEQLSESLARERYQAGRSQAILEGISEGVIVFDHTGRAIHVNPAIQALTGIVPEEIIGLHVDKILADSGLSQREIAHLHTLFYEVQESSDFIKVQFGQKTLAINISRALVSTGDEIGRVAVIHDYTKEADVDRMKSLFLAMVSHELRTPLNSILGYTDMLTEGVYGPLNPQQEGVVERVMANTDRLLTIVNDLLDQAQVEAGMLPVHFRSFRPAELVDSLQQIERQVKAKGLRLDISLTDDLPKALYGDPQRLKQILLNLVSNAVKFTENGVIQVRIYRVDGERWAMQVCDTGIGIPLEAQRYIFDPFKQVDMEITRRHGGIGLGLSLVKHLTDIHQGEVALASQPGKGAVFTVTIPFAVIDQKGIIQNARQSEQTEN